VKFVRLSGWYRVIRVHTENERTVEALKAPRLYLEDAEYPCVFSPTGARWISLRYPDPTIGGKVYVRLEKIEEREKPCKCNQYRFPHKRNQRCPHGQV